MASTSNRTPKQGCFPPIAVVLMVLIVLFILAAIALGPINGQQYGQESAAMQQARSLNLALFSYANDHDGNYPVGASSTEVFQKLLDGGYCSDPSYFYIPRAGKFKADSGQKLKPENVCFDVTSGIDFKSSDDVPVVFSTGYRITYAPGATAIPLKSSPQFNDSRTFLQWWNGDSEPWSDAGIAVAYKNNAARFMELDHVINPDGSMPRPPIYRPEATVRNFISPEFKADGKVYQQLTPEWALP